MDKKVEELYSLLVPLHQNRLIVPRSCIAEVIRYTAPEATEGMPSWCRGFVHWNDRQVPVICFENLCGMDAAPTGGRTRIAMFHAIAGLLQGGFFGILTEGFPQLVRVNPEVMEPADRQAWPEDGPVLCQIRMINEYPIIPDLDRLERLIHECLATVGASVA